MPHFWGANAVVQRIGLLCASRCLPFLIKRWGLPVFLRRMPGKLRSCYYMSEAAVTAWELTMAMRHRETLLAKEREREGRGRRGGANPKRGL